MLKKKIISSLVIISCLIFGVCVVNAGVGYIDHVCCHKPIDKQ